MEVETPLRRYSVNLEGLSVDYCEQATTFTAFIPRNAPWGFYSVGFLENQRLQSLRIDVHKEGATVPSVVDINGLAAVAEGSAVDLAIGACFPKGSTVLVATASRTPTTVGGVVQINGQIWVVRFAVFRGAVRSPLFQEELHRSVKFSWPEPDAK